MPLDILMTLAATFPFSVIQQIISLLDKVEVSFLCRLPSCLPSKPTLTSQQEMWVPLTSSVPFSGLPLPFALSGKVLLQLDFRIAAQVPAFPAVMWNCSLVHISSVLSLSSLYRTWKFISYLMIRFDILEQIKEKNELLTPKKVEKKNIRVMAFLLLSFADQKSEAEFWIKHP